MTIGECLNPPQGDGSEPERPDPDAPAPRTPPRFAIALAIGDQITLVRLDPCRLPAGAAPQPPCSPPRSSSDVAQAKDKAAVWVPQGPLPPPQRPTKGPQAAKSQVESMPGGGGQSLAPLEVTVPVCLVEETSVFGSPLGTTRQALLPQGFSPARRGCPEATCTRRSRCGWEHTSPPAGRGSCKTGRLRPRWPPTEVIWTRSDTPSRPRWADRDGAHPRTGGFRSPQRPGGG